MKRLEPLLLFPSLTVIVLDQAAKAVVTRALRLHETVPVVKGLFNLVNLRNRGIAFGLLNRPGNDRTGTVGRLLPSPVTELS